MAILRYRVKNVIIVAISLLAIVLVLRHAFGSTSSPVPAEPPLAGTYLYYHDVEFKTPNRKLLGAVNHADVRFAPSQDPERGLGLEETRQTLKWLLETYVSKMRDLDVETWLAHGTLLGWYWNERLLPWDTDLDVQMSFETMQRLARAYNGTEFNMTVTHDEDGSTSQRRYLLDVNPHFRLVTKHDPANHIDARWIDMTNGKYLDITAMHLPHERDRDDHRVEITDRLWCKDGHTYRPSDVYPLQDAYLEGIPVRVPLTPKSLLTEEYGERSLRNTRFHWHHFNRKTKLWEAD